MGTCLFSPYLKRETYEAQDAENMEQEQKVSRLSSRMGPLIRDLEKQFRFLPSTLPFLSSPTHSFVSLSLCLCTGFLCVFLTVLELAL